MYYHFKTQFKYSQSSFFNKLNKIQVISFNFLDWRKAAGTDIKRCTATSKTWNQLYIRNNITHGKKLIKRKKFCYMIFLVCYLQARNVNEKKKKISILLTDKGKINKNVSFLPDPLMQLMLKVSGCRKNLRV